MSRKITVNLLESGDIKPVSCRISRGQLISALAPVKIGEGIEGKILCAGRAEGVGRFFISDGEKVYLSVSGKEFYELGALACSSPFIFEEIDEGAPRAVICGGSHALVHMGDSYRGMVCGANYSCGVMHCGRLFGGDGEDGYTLRWSGEGGIEDGGKKLNGAGFLTLDPERGKILDILEYGEKLVLVREYGLTLLNMFGTPENYSAEITNTDTDSIFKNTARVVSGKLLFFTSSGLKSFDGRVVEGLTHRYAADIAAPSCSAEFSGLYFLGCESKTSGERQVLCYDPVSGESYIIPVSADAISATDCVYIFNADGLFKLDGAEEFSFTANTNFGDLREKTLTEIFVDGVCNLEVGNGKISRLFSGVSGRVRPRLRGKNFTVKATGSKSVKSLTAVAEVLNVI